MWSKISEYFKAHPEQLSVVKTLLENGLGIRSGKVFCNEIEIPPIRIARVAKVDRRTVTQTIKTIMRNEELNVIFTHIRSAGLSLKEIARHLEYGVIEITPEDPKMVGILSQAALLIANEKISIRQALVDDPELYPHPKLTLIAERSLPADLIPKFLKIQGVAKVSIY